MKSSNPIVACQRKIAYPTQQLAEDVVTYLYHEKGIDLSVYHCNICEQYHLTGSDKK